MLKYQFVPIILIFKSMWYCTIGKEFFPNYNRAHKYAKKNWILDKEVISEIHVTSPIRDGRRTANIYQYLNGKKYIKEDVNTNSNSTLDKKEEMNTIAKL